ncbi:Hypothetical protein FKW44_015306 [Caligus rogercresseyi]|uniref:Uncharacterized protein n=1 Tax=Caligus rogercresseyi TaxID=217165 RepID=A0A7T8H0A0_CALRO|nr:Hypothetical protein FKW44_015306 [Caligus rogercresseyi]
MGRRSHQPGSCTDRHRRWSKNIPGLQGHCLGGHLVEGGKACSLKEVADVDMIPSFASNDAPSSVIYGDLYALCAAFGPLHSLSSLGMVTAAAE